jgi:hypothetical protein
VMTCMRLRSATSQKAVIFIFAAVRTCNVTKHSYLPNENIFHKAYVSLWDFKFSRWRVWCSELSSGLYCCVKWLSTDVSEVRTASIIRDE